MGAVSPGSPAAPSPSLEPPVRLALQSIKVRLTEYTCYLLSNFSHRCRPTLPMMCAHTQLKSKEKKKKPPHPKRGIHSIPLSSFSVTQSTPSAPLKSSVHNMRPVSALSSLTPGPTAMHILPRISPRSRLLHQRQLHTPRGGAERHSRATLPPWFFREAQG